MVVIGGSAWWPMVVGDGFRWRIAVFRSVDDFRSKGSSPVTLVGSMEDVCPFRWLFLVPVVGFLPVSLSQSLLFRILPVIISVDVRAWLWRHMAATKVVYWRFEVVAGLWMVVHGGNGGGRWC
ncbi:hypothetical protein HanIR_Chr01g0034411 [Helianthus annuus]|nr:hypothetical protein HanIR_Chr01g0034411 [Helianthus annuus]